MKKTIFTLLLTAVTLMANSCNGVQKSDFQDDEVALRQTITFKASDGLLITADLYANNPDNSPMIILFHQARWSRGEYREIAPKLNDLGFNCIAIDQRSGGEVNGVVNETHQRAEKQKLGTTYVDAETDIKSAIEYVKKTYPKAKKIIIWGSSYSSALVLKIGGDRNDIDAILAFAPGEYFEDMGKPADYVTESAKNIMVPVFITSSKAEKENWWNIYEVIPSIGKDYFVPETDGNHGSRALWEKFDDSRYYWKAVTEFLKRL